MKRITMTGALGILIGFGIAPSAQAQWYAHVSQSDVFGNRTVDAFAVANSGDGLVVQCDQKHTLKLAYIFPANAKEVDQATEMSGVPVKLFMKVDKNAVIKLSATMEPWNNTHAGFVVSGRRYATVKAIQEMGTAQAVIGVGVDLMGHHESDNFTAAGSTAAMQTVIKDCKLDGIKAPQRAPNSSTVPAPVPESGSTSG